MTIRRKVIALEARGRCALKPELISVSQEIDR
jgi:hypothetical protein